jgi:hypothetical protein
MAVTAAQTTNIAPGFARSLGVSVQTPEVSLGASDAAQIYQSIEGYRVARLAWGTANAQPITLGFWTMHHRPGLYSGAITNSAGNRCYAFTYTQSAADVAQYNVATIPGDTAGIWATDNTIGMNVIFALAAGSSATAPSANTWLAGSYAAAPGQVNAVAATSDAFRITGVVVLPGIEAPSSARSALIMRPFDQELVMCQRYWRKQITFAIAGYGLAASASGAYLPFSPVMRATPTLSQSGAGVLNAGPLTANSTNQTGFWLQTVVTATGAFYSFSDLSLDARL